MMTNWTAPKAGATLSDLFFHFHEWPKHVSKEHRCSARTNLAVTQTGVIEDYDLRRLHSENLEVEP